LQLSTPRGLAENSEHWTRTTCISHENTHNAAYTRRKLTKPDNTSSED
jgi:hypothetical protein